MVGFLLAVAAEQVAHWRSEAMRVKDMERQTADEREMREEERRL